MCHLCTYVPRVVEAEVIDTLTFTIDDPVR
jgi:hypothetical protein